MTATRGVIKVGLPCDLGPVSEVRTHQSQTEAAIGRLESLGWRFPSSDAIWGLATEPFTIYTFRVDLPVIQMPEGQPLALDLLPGNPMWAGVCGRARLGEIAGLFSPLDDRLVLTEQAAANLKPIGLPMHTTLAEFIPDYLLDTLGPPPPEVRRSVIG